VTIGASYGDAFLAGITANLCRPNQSWNDVEGRVEPSSAAAGPYEDLYSLYGALYPATSVHMHRLAALQAQSRRGDGLGVLSPLASGKEVANRAS
jgi:xylulokinase